MVCARRAEGGLVEAHVHRRLKHEELEKRSIVGGIAGAGDASTLEQLATVAADTGAGLGGGLLSYVVAGGIRVGPPDVTSPTLIKPSDTVI